MSFIERLGSFYSSIESVSNKIELYTTSNPEEEKFKARTIDRAFKSINEDSGSVKLKEHQKEYINLSGRFKLDWIYSAPEPHSIDGGFRFTGLWESLSLNSKLFKSLKDDNVPYQVIDEEVTFLAQLNPFVTAFDGRKVYGCFLRNTINFPPSIYFYDYGIYLPMNVDLDGYLAAMYASFATYRWQYFYIDEFSPEMLDRMGKLFRTLSREELVQELERIANSLPKAFPNHDFSYHQQRLVFLKEVLLGS